MKLIFLLLTSLSLSAQPFTMNDVAMGVSRIASAPLTFRFITNVAETANNAAHATPVSQATANSLILCCAIASGANTAIPTVAGYGLTWDCIFLTNINSGAINASLWRTMSASTPSSGAVTVTWNATTGGHVYLAEFSGVDTTGTRGSGAVVQSGAKTNATTTTPTITLGSAMGSANNGMFVMASDNDNNGGYYLSGLETGWSNGFDGGYNTPATGLFTAYHLGGTAGNDNSWGITAAATSPNAIIAIEVKKNP